MLVSGMDTVRDRFTVYARNACCKTFYVYNLYRSKKTKQNKTRRCSELRCMYDFPIKLVLGTTPSAAGTGPDPLLLSSLNERNETSNLDKMQPVHDNTEPVQPVHYV